MKTKSLLFAALLASVAAYAQPSVTTAGAKYVVIEEGTGAWCGYCPEGDYILEGILASTPRTIAISIHDNINTIRGDLNSYDMMEATDGTGYDFTHTTGYCNGYPQAAIDRVPAFGKVGQTEVSWAYYTNLEVTNSPKFDVTLLHAYNASTNTLTVWVYAKTLIPITGKYNINAVITEDSIASVGPGYEQHSSLFRNSSSHFYHVGTPNSDTSSAILGPADYVHLHVLRSYLGGAFGDDSVIADNAPAYQTYSKKYTYTIPATYKKKNLHIVGMVQKYNATDVNDRAVDNGIQAQFDSTAVQLSLDEVAGELESVAIFPNPATTNCLVFARTTTNENIQISITNIIGQTVLQYSAKAANRLISENINIEALPNGIYLVDVSGGNTSVKKKLVVNK